MGLVILQLVVIDLVFSIDSIVTAIGMSRDIRIMVAAVLIAVAVMYAASGPVARFVANHPTTKMLALAFLLLIGVALVADGFDFHIPRGYIYFAMAFAAVVEAFNVLAARKRRASQEEDHDGPQDRSRHRREPRHRRGDRAARGGAGLRRRGELHAGQGRRRRRRRRRREGGPTRRRDPGRRRPGGRCRAAVRRPSTRELGRLTDLVYNAGITGPVSRIENLSTDAAREILDINVLGAVLRARAAIPRLSTKAQGGAGGAIVLLSSAMATLGGAGEYVMYSASKGAVESLSIGLARELAAEGIRVNVVEPGPDRHRHPPARPARAAHPRWCRWGAPARRRRSPRRSCSCSRNARRSRRARCCGSRAGGEAEVAADLVARCAEDMRSPGLRRRHDYL